MKKYGLNELRESYLEFFRSKGHIILPSFSLVPRNDPSLLLINAGMAPLKNYFTGAEQPPGRRMATCQKCIRTPDIENVGKTARHGTFFEMLGNFSFGDYFKKEAIAWAWEYFIEVLGFDTELIYVSVFEEDDEAYEIWKQVSGFPDSKIVRLGRKDNFWEHGTGPCGPCSEIYIDRGMEYGCGSADCRPGCDCDRFIEVWNLVFTQYDKDEQGRYNPLPNPNIDTGMGLERLAVVCQGANNMFEVDTIRGIIDRVCVYTGKTYGADANDDISIRVITDHIRGITHMISDGVVPSNEGRGYVLRRLLRRAARHIRLLGCDRLFLHELSAAVIELSSDAYPALEEKKAHISKVILIESEKFNRTIDQGTEILHGILKDSESGTVSGEDAFRLHDTYGFPLDLTREIAQENGKTVDEKSFTALMASQKNKAREAFKSKSIAWSKEDSAAVLVAGLSSEFTGYSSITEKARVIGLFAGDTAVTEAYAGETVSVVFDKTPFYAEGGGQAADRGEVLGEVLRAAVIDVKKAGPTHVHILVIDEGAITAGGEYALSVDIDARSATARNHTATHILHKALNQVLGAHAEQRGSYVDDSRLRFDYSHYEAAGKAALSEIEKRVNQVIMQAHPVKTDVTDPESAKNMGAKALFGEKYGTSVRVLSVGNYSMELCGGTHVSNSGEIGSFHILSESGIAAGTRRIEAITGSNTLRYFLEKEKQLEDAAALLKSTPDDVSDRITILFETNKMLAKELDAMKLSIARTALNAEQKPEQINGIYLYKKLFNDIDGKQLLEKSDAIKSEYPDSVIMLAAVSGDKVSFLVYCCDKAVDKGVNAGAIVKEMAQMAGGGGGGRATLAQAGGKLPEKAEEALETGYTRVKTILA